MPTQTLCRAPDGPALERWRLSLGLSRERLGAAAGGISSATVRRIEREQVRPQPSTIAAILRALRERSGAAIDPINVNDGAETTTAPSLKTPPAPGTSQRAQAY
jgi:predicted transcriptional regulator